MQTVLVWIIVFVAVVYLVRKYVRTLSGKGQGCDCGTGCNSCSASNRDQLCDFPKNDPHKTDSK